MRLEMISTRKLLFFGERENLERSGVSVSIVILLFVVAAVSQHVALRVPGDRKCRRGHGDLGHWKENAQLLSLLT